MRRGGGKGERRSAEELQARRGPAQQPAAGPGVGPSCLLPSLERVADQTIALESFDYDLFLRSPCSRMRQDECARVDPTMSTPAGIRSPFSARPPWADRWTLRRQPSDSLRLFSSPLLLPTPSLRSSLTFRQDGSRTPEGTSGRVVSPLLPLCFASLNLRSCTLFLTSGSGPGRQRCQVSLVSIYCCLSYV